jgi:hypothetical protein
MDAAHAVTRQPRPTTPEDLHRLAALAQARGLRLTQESETVWFCSSASQHVDPHYVTGLSCDCRGFQEHQRCTHHAAAAGAPGLAAGSRGRGAGGTNWCHAGRLPALLGLRRGCLPHL